MHVLILGGTTEARRLAELLHGTPGLELTSSLAGRVASPRLPPGEVRVGGFGGAAGLAEWLREHAVDALIDATHPFAGTMSFHAAQAAATAHVPLLALRRPGWVPVEGDDWHEYRLAGRRRRSAARTRAADLPHHRPDGPRRLRGPHRPVVPRALRRRARVAVSTPHGGAA